MWKFVTSVHGTAAGCPDIDGGALLVYQKPVYLRLHDHSSIDGSADVPNGEEGLPICESISGIFY